MLKTSTLRNWYSVMAYGYFTYKYIHIHTLGSQEAMID